MNQKKLIQIIVIFVIALWAFCASLMISTSIAKKNQQEVSAPAGADIPPVITTTAPQTTTQPSASSATEQYPSVEITLGNNVSQSVSVGDPNWKVSVDASVSASKQQAELEKLVPEGTANIIKAYVEGVNRLKNTESFTMKTNGTLDITFSKITGGNAAQGLAGKAIEDNAPADTTYSFVNGVDQTTGETPVTAVPPFDKYASLEADFVKQAAATPTGDGGYKIIIQLHDDTQTLNAEAQAHSSAVEDINIEKFLPSGVTLSSISINYSGTVVEATFDKDNRITSLRNRVGIESATGSGVYKMLVPIDIEFTLSGEQTRNCIITY